MATVSGGGDMRALMPRVTAFIDALRAAFGTQYINRQIALGLRNGTFYASENGHTLGVESSLAGLRVVTDGGWCDYGVEQRAAARGAK